MNLGAAARTIGARVVSGALVGTCIAIAITAVASASPGQPGSIDTSFGGSGAATLPFTPAAIAVQPDGKIVVVGTESSNGQSSIAIARLTAAGALDSDFGSAGVALVAMGGFGQATSIALQSDGGIVVAGGLQRIGVQAVVARVTGSGHVDTTFNGTGVKAVGDAFGQTVDNGNPAVAVAVQPDQKIVVVVGGSVAEGSGFTLFRLTAAGAADSGFNGTGSASVTINGRSVPTALAVRSDDGKIVVGGYGNNAAGTGEDIQVAQFTPSGALDTTFDPTGAVAGTKELASQKYAESYAMTLQPDGKILLAGLAAGNSNGCGSGARTLVARLTTVGSPDDTFGSSGLLSVPVAGASFDCAVGIISDQKGRILLAQSAEMPADGGHIAVAGLTSAGAIDPGFGDGNPQDEGAGNPTGGIGVAGGDVVLPAQSGSSTSGTQTDSVLAVHDKVASPTEGHCDWTISVAPSRDDVLWGGRAQFTISIGNAGTDAGVPGSGTCSGELAVDASDTGEPVLLPDDPEVRGFSHRHFLVDLDLRPGQRKTIPLPAENCIQNFAFGGCSAVDGHFELTAKLPSDGDQDADEASATAVFKPWGPVQKTAKVDRRGSAELLANCPVAHEECTLSGSLTSSCEPGPDLSCGFPSRDAIGSSARRPAKLLGRLEGSVPGGKSAKVELTLTPTGLSLLRHRHKLVGLLEVTLRVHGRVVAGESHPITLRLNP